MLNIIPIPAFNDNYIWLITNPDNNHAVIVDPGDAEPVLDAISEKGIILDGILITHHHYDHIGGIARILDASPVSVYAAKRETIPLVSNKLVDGDAIHFKNLDLTFEVLEIPAHTDGHIAYYAPGMLFSGDTLFTGGCGRLFEGTAKQMVTSLNKLSALPDDTLIYCGHEYTEHNLAFAQTIEPNNDDLQKRIIESRKLREQGLPTVPASLALEKQTNPFLRCHVAEVIQSAEKYVGRALKDDVDVLSTLRQWKDHF